MLLIDDVVTSGATATANACAQALRHGSVAAAGVLVAVRVPAPG